MNMKLTASTALFNARLVPTRAGAPEFRLRGNVYGDLRQRWPNGSDIGTSKVVSMFVATYEDGNEWPTFITMNGSAYRVETWHGELTR